MTPDELPTIAAAFAQASSEMLSAVLDQSADCIKVIGPAGTVDYMNRNGQCAMEVDDFCVIAGQQWSALWPKEASGLIEAAIVKARGGNQARFEAFCPTAKGSPRWWDVSVSPLRSPGGTVEGFIATSRDVTDRVNKTALRDAVADEMRHRLRNNYVVVGSLLSAHARGRPDQEDFAKDMIGRLNALSVAQTMKAAEGESCALEPLVRSLLDPFPTADCPIRIGALPDARLDQGLIDALALVLGELAVNSAKHGALSARGTVTVAGEIGDGQIVLTWSERSDREVTDHQRGGGQGLRLMSRVLAARGGGIDLVWADRGLDATVRVEAG